MKLNKRELKKRMYDFNRISNRLMQSDFNDYSNNLTRFIQFLNDDEIIFGYIKSCGEPTLDIKSEVETVKSHYNAIFETGYSEQEETSNIYHILSYIVKNNIPVSYSIALSYAHGSNHYQDGIESFNNRFVQILINNIEGYLTKVGIDMGYDDKQVYNINVTNGQVNIAQDQATLHASNEVNNGTDIEKLDQMINKVLESCNQDNKQELDKINENLMMIKNELMSKEPNKDHVNLAISSLKAINAGTAFAASLATLISFVQNFL